MSGQVTAPLHFVRDFVAVHKHYDSPPEEIAEARHLARGDMENAMRSYYLMARELDVAEAGDVWLARNRKARGEDRPAKEEKKAVPKGRVKTNRYKD